MKKRVTLFCKKIDLWKKTKTQQLCQHTTQKYQLLISTGVYLWRNSEVSKEESNPLNCSTLKNSVLINSFRNASPPAVLQLLTATPARRSSRCSSAASGTHQRSCCHPGLCFCPDCGCDSDLTLCSYCDFCSCRVASQTSPCTGHSCRSICRSPSTFHRLAFSLWF